jgi:uncharacterized protein (TIGR02217 family)
MSNAVFPTLPGLTWPVVKRPVTSSIVQTTASGKELRATTQRRPLLEWGLQYEVLRTRTVLGVGYTEYEQLAGFFNARGGRRDSFLFNDLADNATTFSVFGEGDGVTTTFRLGRAIGGGVVQIGGVNTVTAVYIDGVATGAYTITGNEITFSSPPPACAELAWSGTYYFRVRFRDDALDFSNFMQYLWENRTVWLRQVKGGDS